MPGCLDAWLPGLEAQNNGENQAILHERTTARGIETDFEEGRRPQP